MTICVAQHGASAQSGREDRVLRPSTYRPVLGISIGAAYAASTGRFATTCNCAYSQGWGVDPNASIVFELPVSRLVRLTAAAQYIDISTSYTAREVRSEYVRNTGQYEDVEFERTADVGIAYAGLSVGALVSSGVGGLHLLAGFSFLTPVRDHFTESEHILSKGVAYATTSATSKTYIDGSFGDLYFRRDLRVTADLGVGYDIPAASRMVVTPRFLVEIPLTSVIAQHADWRIVDVRIDATAKFIL